MKPHILFSVIILAITALIYYALKNIPNKITPEKRRQIIRITTFICMAICMVVVVYSLLNFDVNVNKKKELFPAFLPAFGFFLALEAYRKNTEPGKGW